jgi:hypothetical protein
MKIVAISDFHGILPYDLPECEYLLVGGDISPFDIQSNHDYMELWFSTLFKEWVRDVPCKTIALIAGNHDFYLRGLFSASKRNKFIDQFGGKLIYLQNNFCILGEGKNSLRIFGCPYCSRFGNWPFMLDNNQLAAKYREIDTRVDVLLVHDPGYKICNTDVMLEPIHAHQIDKGHIGSKPLTKRLIKMTIDDIAPTYMLSGHIHSADHNINIYGNTKVACISLMDERCDRLVYPPLEIEI